LRTGDNGEYMVAWGIVGVCVVLAMLFKPHGGAGWYPFFYDWAGLYQSGVIDAKEWKDNRLKFF
jgi:inner membrane protein